MRPVLPNKVQENVRNYMTTRVLVNRTQLELATQCELTQATISEILNRRRNVTAHVVITLARLTGDSVAYIMGESQVAQHPPLGDLPGYREAERTVRLFLSFDFGNDFWLSIRDTVFSPHFERVTSELLYLIVKTGAMGWERDNVDTESK